VELTQLETIGAILGVVASAAALIRILWVHAPKLYRKLRHNMFGIGDIKTDIAALTEQVGLVVQELQPNGGASVRDSLNRIELRQVLQEQRQKAILSDMSVGVFETDHDGNYIWVNRKYLRMTGRAPDEVKGSGWINTIAKRDRERVVMAWNKAIAAGREFEEEFTMITPDDDRVKVQARTYKMDSKPKGTLGFLGMLAPLCEKGKHL
jgi:PAS domain S-box-containing protein